MDLFLPWDQGILNSVQQYMKSDFLDWLMPIVTALGDAGFLWILIAVFCLLNKKYRSVGIALTIGMVLCFIIVNLGLKPLVARARPFEWNESIQLLIAKPMDFSFPSGHSAFSFVAATILWKANRRVGTVALVVAGLIAFSRIYLYVHYPTDVIAGIVIGTLIGLGVGYYSEKLGMRSE